MNPGKGRYRLHQVRALEIGAKESTGGASECPSGRGSSPPMAMAAGGPDHFVTLILFSTVLLKFVPLNVR